MCKCGWVDKYVIGCMCVCGWVRVSNESREETNDRVVIVERTGKFNLDN